MKRKLLIALIVLVVFALPSSAQLPVNSIAPNWTLTDIDGNSHTLYDYLDQGKTVVIDFSTTWCSPCWNYHQSHALKEVYINYGPNGSDEMMVFWVEGDLATDSDDLHGTGASTQGDWVTGIPYPIIDVDELSIIENYRIPGWPTIYLICPDRIIKYVDIGAMNSSPAMLYAQQADCSFGQFTNDVKIFNTYGPDGTICSSFVPILNIQNYGSQILSSMDILSKIDEEVVNTYNWTGSLAQYELEIITLPEIFTSSMTNGDHVFTYETANPNGVADEDNSNNIVDKDIFINSNTTPVVLSIMPDMYPSDISWYVKKGNSTLFSGGGYSFSDTIITETLCLEADTCYTFFIYDVHNNGFTMDSGTVIMTWLGNELFKFSEVEHSGPSYSVDFCVVYDGIHNQKNNLSPVGFSMFPNPVNNVLYIKLNSEIDNIIKVTITNSSGKIMKQVECIRMSDEILMLDELNFQNGIYFVTVETHNTTMSKKLIYTK